MPKTVSLPGPVITALAAGELHSCAVANGNAYCWGAGNNGMLGNGGAAHVCAVTEPNNIECWGRGDAGQLGATNFADSATPVLVPLW